MRKNILVKLVTVVFITAFMFTFNVMAENNVAVYVNDEKLEVDAIIKDGRTLVPARGVFEKLYFEVQYLPETKSAWIYNKDTSVTITYGSNHIEVDSLQGSDVELDVPAQIINDRFYIPLRAIAESIGAIVEWDEKTKSAHVIYDEDWFTTGSDGKILKEKPVSSDSNVTVKTSEKISNPSVNNNVLLSNVSNSNESTKNNVKRNDEKYLREKEKELFLVINEERVKRGLSSLIWDEKLAISAKNSSKNLALVSSKYSKEVPSYCKKIGIYKNYSDSIEIFRIEDIYEYDALCLDASSNYIGIGLYNGDKETIWNIFFSEINIEDVEFEENNSTINQEKNKPNIGDYDNSHNYIDNSNNSNSSTGNDLNVSEIEYNLYLLINEERQKKNLAPLEWDTNLANAAHNYTVDWAMKETQRGLDTKDYIDAQNAPNYCNGYDLSAGGNNKTPVDFIQSNSRNEHNAYLYNRYKYIGVGYSYSNGTYYWGIFLSEGYAGYVIGSLDDFIDNSINEEQYNQKTPSEQEKLPETISNQQQVPSEATTNNEEKTYNIEQLEQQVFELVNEIRLKEGLQPLEWSESLADMARNHSSDMSKNGYFSHTSLDGSSPSYRAKKMGIDNYAAENIAGGNLPTADMVVSAWMKSEGHKANILNPDIKYLGVGARTSSFGGYYWTQVFGY